MVERKKLNLGCGNTPLDGYINIDKFPFSPDVINHDLESGLPEFIDNDSVEYVLAHHVLEHVRNLDTLLKDIYRVCKNGAIIDIVVPLANTLWDVADPSHVRRFNHKTFEYYCKGFSTSYATTALFIMEGQNVISEVSQWFDGVEWKVANLHTILRVSK